MGFHKIAPYYYTGWHEPATELQFLVNERKFSKLPKDLQKILITAMRVAAYDMYVENYHMNAEAWAQIATDYPNVKIKTLPENVIKAMKKANDELLVDMAKESPLLKEVLESQKAYMKKAREWTKMADYKYLEDNL